MKKLIAIAVVIACAGSAKAAPIQWATGQSSEEAVGLPPVVVGQLALPVTIDRIAIDSHVVFACHSTYTAGENRVYVIDVANPAAPALLSSLTLSFPPDLPAAIWQIVAKSGYLYVTAGEGGVTVVDATVPQLPVVVSRQGWALGGIALSGNNAYIGYLDGLEIASISDPPAINWIRSYYPMSDCYSDLEIAGNCLFSIGSGNLVISDISHFPSVSRLSATAITSLSYGSAFVEGGRAFVANYWGSSVSVLDVSNPLTPVLLSTLSLPDRPRDVAVVNDIAYVAAQAAGLCMYDVSDAVHPVSLGQLNTSGSTTAIARQDEFLYLADGPGGLLICRVDTGPVAAIDKPSIGGGAASIRHVYPNPFSPCAAIAYDLGKAGRLRLSIFDLAGRLVRTLVDESKSQGSFEAVWDGRDASGKEVGSGTYLARLSFGGRVETVRMTLVQ